MKKILIIIFIISAIYAQRRNFSNYPCPAKCVCYGKSVRCMKLQLNAIPRIPMQTTLLDFRFNSIREIERSSFESCPHIRSLLLNNNLLSELRNGTFKSLAHLRHLYLHENTISHIENGVFQSLLKLEYLYLHNNKLSSISNGTFSYLPSLTRIFLHNNRIKQLSPNLFIGVPKLVRLRLDGNPLICNCEIAQLISTLNSSALQVDAYCDAPSEVKGLSLKELILQDLHCVPELKEIPIVVKVTSGKIAVVHCNITEDTNKSQKVVWLRNNIKIDWSNKKYEFMDDGSLMIRNISSEDKGFYKCQTKYNNQHVKSRTARMVVIQNENTNYGPPKIIQKPVSITTVNGAPSALLACRSIGNPEPITSWSFNGVELTPSKKYNISKDGNLIIRPVEFGDHGTYTCFVKNSYGRRTAKANLLISSAPVFTAQPENMVLNIGSTIKLECFAAGLPKPQISWYKDNIQIQSSSRVSLSEDGTILSIGNVNKGDSGMYICRARNSFGSIEVAAEIEVQDLKSKRPTFRFQPYNIEAFVGSTIEIPCQAEGHPSPGIQWQKDGATIQRTGRARTSLTGSIYIHNVQIEDQGRYECIAINDFGRNTASGYLTVKEDPTVINIGGIGDQYVKISFLEASAEIDKSINNTIQHFLDNKGPHSSGELFKLFRYPDAPTRELAKAAEIYERTLVNIRKHITNGLKINSTKEYNYREILSKEHLDLIAQLSGCTSHRRMKNCSDVHFHNKYRSMDGTCNNFKNPTWGASLTPFRRILKPIYEDGFGKPVGWEKNRTYFGYPKPLARLVSISVISTNHISPDDKITHMVMQWGQFLDHDLDHALPAVSSQSWDGIDCKKTCDYAAPCFPMEVPPNDPRIRNRRCIDFIRTSAVCGSGITSVFFDDIQPREQLNQLTSYIDASQVYGYSEEISKSLRDLNNDGGRLREGPQFTGWKPLLPFASNEGMDCRRNLSESDINCFAAGDIRVNEQAGLIAMHTIWMREHNRLARRLKQLNPHWNGETIYHEARKIVGAAMQHITYKHWLPYIIGETGVNILGTYQEYNPNIQAEISNVFATAALRFGHTMINPVLHRLNENFQPIREGHLPLRFAFFAPWRIVNEGGVDPLLRGLFTVPAKLKKPTENLNSELTEHLFRSAHAVALDLAAMNIQRSRDHALPGYVEYRKFCNMTKVERFEDMSFEINQEILKKLQELYGHPGNIDVFVGGILENPVEDGKVGPLFQCLLIEQFRRLRDGDRFFFENPSVFRPQQLAQITKYSLSRIICDNGDNITKITENVFLLPHHQGGLVDCSKLPEIDLSYWTDL
ncbi:hypothetical protein WA026_020172 [Henosepilachna vigintioctopunctata]|uniref:Ig-like domain-containing protein n=1 Tax=Henosepilachna vigintioctopunctata TaxID=420089 RepID=A0AAW1UCT3_9CUCU